MKEQFACEHLHQHDWMGENGGKGAQQKRACVHHPGRGGAETVGSTSGKRERDVRPTVASYFPKTGGRPGGRTPGVTGLKREAAITCSLGGFDEALGTRSHVASL
ncbi:hypothetical protein AMTRI_Chr09g43290 [Amborella trichopoda]